MEVTVEGVDVADTLLAEIIAGDVGGTKDDGLLGVFRGELCDEVGFARTRETIEETGIAGCECDVLLETALGNLLEVSLGDGREFRFVGTDVLTPDDDAVWPDSANVINLGLSQSLEEGLEELKLLVREISDLVLQGGVDRVGLELTLCDFSRLGDADIVGVVGVDD